MAQYKKLFEEMLSAHQELFKEFRIQQDLKPRNKGEFNKVGEKVLEVIQKYIDDLCRTSEGTGFGKYSQNLSDKFWGEVRSEFPDIDDIGVE